MDDPVEVAPVRSKYLERWFSRRALGELLAFRARIDGTHYPELWQVVLSRSARSARLTRHDDLDFPREPVTKEYTCNKHRRVCRPVGEAQKFLDRYVRDAAQRVQEFADLRTTWPVRVYHDDARMLEPPGPIDLVVTSPPYPGLIDYHGQHVYAYELLGLERRDSDEIGRGVKGYCEGVAAALGRAAEAVTTRGRIVIVVNDSRGLYDGILEAAGLRLEERVLRHVNRRTGGAPASTTKKFSSPDRREASPACPKAAPRGPDRRALRPSPGRHRASRGKVDELLAALPERERVLEVGLAALELRDNPLELLARLFEAELGAHRPTFGQ